MKTVVGSFDSHSHASQAAAKLLSAGFMQSDINVISNNTTRAGASDDSRNDRATSETSGVTTGALTGGALGGAAGIAVSMLGLAVPGIGPILAAGALATVLAGAGAGAVAGGLIGGLTDMGVSDSDAEYYAESVRRGGSLVTVRVDESRVDEAESILRDQGGIDIEERAGKWHSDGWEGFDEKASTFSYDEIEQERARYRASTARNSTLGV